MVRTRGFEEQLRERCQREINNVAAKQAIAKPASVSNGTFSNNSVHDPKDYLRPDELRDCGLAPQIP